ncbi:hypothetical protein HYW54_03210 [Candidatus Gottesmanbacteria bacterium]|nr:hypothetical protein [Candidatus Gottesmanbacteria bacterium]
MKDFIKEFGVALVLLILSMLLLNPGNTWMPGETSMMILAGLVITFVFFASFIYKEKVSDEREAYHRFLASRYAYLLGTSVLVLGVTIQTFQHTLDPWLVLTLITMILGKIAGQIYGKIKH